MTNRMRVYTKILRTLKKDLKMFHQGYTVTLAMMITGIVMGKKAQLSVMSAEIPHNAKDKSILDSTSKCNGSKGRRKR